MKKDFRLFVAGLLLLGSPAALHAFAPGEWVQGGHSGSVLSVAVSPSGELAASGSEDGTIKLWRVSDGSLIRTMANLASQVGALAFSPDGSLVACGYYDGRVGLWDVATGTQVRTITASWRNAEINQSYTGNQGVLRSIAFSPDGGRLASGGGDWSMRVWTVSNGFQVTNRVQQTGFISSVAFSPDGTSLACASEDGTVDVLNGGNYSVIRTVSHVSNVVAVAFSPDNQHMVSAGLDNVVKVWRTADGSTERTLDAPGVTCLSFAGDGSRLFAGQCSGAISSWAAGSDWSLVKSWQAHTGAVLSVAGGKDGALVLSGGSDHQFKIWNASGEPSLRMRTPGQSGVVALTACSPDGSVIASSSTDGSVVLRSTIDGAQLGLLTGHTDFVSALAFSPDSTLLATGAGCLDSTVKIYSLPDLRLVRSINAQTNGVAALSFSRDGSLIASAGDRAENVIRCWRVSDGTVLQSMPGHSAGTAALAFSPDGALLASGGNYTDGSIVLWNISNGAAAKTIPDAHAGGVASIAFNPDGNLLVSVGRKDNSVRVWSAADGGQVTTFTLAQRGRAAAFSPDGKLLAASGAGAIQFWRTTDWQPVLAMTDELFRVGPFAFSPNGGFLVFGRQDGSAGRLRNPLGSTPQLALTPPSAAPDGLRLAIQNPGRSPYVQVQVSSNLKDWTVLTNIVTGSEVLTVADPVSQTPARFYRVSTPE